MILKAARRAFSLPKPVQGVKGNLIITGDKE